MGIIRTREENNCKITLWETTETLKELLQLSHIKEVPDFNTEKRKKEWLSIRILLKKISPNTTLSYNKYGSPKLDNENYISISHSQGLIAIIISKQQVGLDIEEISEKALRVAAKFISKNNLKALTNEKATLIWCCKEAIYKWNQKGGVDFIADIKLHPFKNMKKGEITAEFKDSQLILHYQKIHNHYLVYVCK
ncbi:4'-phosphopantetheinyl transferase superfamily protein [Flavobacteriales bacterium]|nr:4'-phosphopantetheinyl transferase superfamily protein [Flavobacteriales bacterium]